MVGFVEVGSQARNLKSRVSSYWTMHLKLAVFCSLLVGTFAATYSEDGEFARGGRLREVVMEDSLGWTLADRTTKF